MANATEVYAGSGAMGGVMPPKILSGMGIGDPVGRVITSSDQVTYSANDLIYIPIFIPRIVTFAGCKTYNSGTGDNGDTYKCALYSEGASGGPDSLLKDFGEVTLTASSAIQTLASSYTMTTVGWHFFGIWFNDGSEMFALHTSARTTNVGYAPGAGIENHNPHFGFHDHASGGGIPFAHHVNTAYGAWASTAVAPTTSQGNWPNFRLYV